MASDLTAKERLIVALDVTDVDKAMDLVNRLDGLVSFFKIGFTLFMRGGPDFVWELLKDSDKKVFLDLKVNDIPEVVGNYIEMIGQARVSFATIHGNGEYLEAAIRGRGSKDLKIFAVTALTSWDANDITEIFDIEIPMEEYVVRRARYFVDIGCDGVITSPLEVSSIREAVSPDVLVVSPGIRLLSDPPNEHKRYADPATAIRSGANYIVVGRPIIHASDPFRAAQRYIDAIEKGLAKDESLEDANPQHDEDFNVLLTAAVPKMRQGART
ncbi:MAG: orotidine-5'-phosphate decarboxylase [Nitrospinae bacterium]|nr:orotidine-5'-phosphate decarboxylase [Nitrospinota bacterium]